jgi:DNA-binding response OmpR family regulator
MKVAGYSYDCILLDIMLPDNNGLRLLGHIRAMGKRENVIIVSARNSLEDKVYGLENGADDYLPKPFHTAELIARVKSVLRRGRTAGELLIEFGNVSINPESRTVMVGGKPLALVKKEFDILLYFMQRPGHMVDKVVLAEAVWGDYADDSDNFQFVYAQIKNLRRKLSEAGASIEITSVYGFGYKLVIKEEVA